MPKQASALAQRHRRISLTPEERRKLARETWTAPHPVEGTMTGIHRSPYHGNAIEFAEHREYVRGDDLRHMDWKVWARTDRFVVKQFEEETNANVLAVMDGAASMAYPSLDSPEKLDYMLRLLMGLRVVFGRQHDRLKGLLWRQNHLHCSDNLSQHDRPGARWLDPFLQWECGESPRWDQLGKLVKQRLPRRGFVVVMTDGFNQHEALLRGLRQCKSAGHVLIVCHVLHEDEVTFPFKDATEFVGLGSQESIALDPEVYRQRYQEALQEDRESFMTVCKRAGAISVPCDTSMPVDKVLGSAIRLTQAPHGHWRRA